MAVIVMPEWLFRSVGILWWPQHPSLSAPLAASENKQQVLLFHDLISLFSVHAYNES